MKKLYFTPFPTLKTERLVFRQLEEADNKEIFFLRSDDEVNKYIDRLRPKNLDEASEFISKINNGIVENEWIYWAITLKDKPKLIGTICLWNISKEKTIAELGYELNPEFHGQGIMNEALNHILDYGFQKGGLKKIEAFTHRDNHKSTTLLFKNNFIHDVGRKDKGNKNNIILSIKKPNLQ
ncbi:MAG: N-acetyltransferase [Bacteroidetes bacterium]|nr:MAG: N-acetyltransferase [Bacteroidota bacterium]